MLIFERDTDRKLKTAATRYFESLPWAEPLRETLRGPLRSRLGRDLRVLGRIVERRWWMTFPLLAILVGTAVAVVVLQPWQSTVGPYILSALLGVLTSIIAWMVIARVLSPDFLLDSIVRCELSEDGTLRYRIVLQNRRFWSATDVRASVRLTIPMVDVLYGRGDAGHTRFVSVAIEIPNSLPAQLVSINKRGKDIIETVVFRDADLNANDLQRYGRAMQDDETLIAWMRGMQEVGALAESRSLRPAQARLHVAVRAAHWYSGTYRTTTRAFTIDDFRRVAIAGRRTRWFLRASPPEHPPSRRRG